MKPPPARRLRGAFPHLSCSMAARTPISSASSCAFVAHRSFPFSCRGRSNSSHKDATESPASSRRRIAIFCKNANTARRIAHTLAARCFLHCPDIPKDRFHVMAQAGCMLVPYRPELGDDVISSWCFPRCPQDPPPSTHWACISPAAHIPGASGRLSGSGAMDVSRYSCRPTCPEFTASRICNSEKRMKPTNAIPPEYHNPEIARRAQEIEERPNRAASGELANTFPVMAAIVLSTIAIVRPSCMPIP